MASTTSSAAAATSSAIDSANSGTAQSSEGLSLVALLTSIATAAVLFAIQITAFLLLRNKLSRIYKPKTYLVPERERTDPPPVSPWGLVASLMKFEDREIIKKCGLDAYFFLRYLKTLLVIFVPLAFVIIPILIPINYVGGIGQSVVQNQTDTDRNSSIPTGLDTLAWGNVKPSNSGRRWAHLILAILAIIWVCFVLFSELRVYIKVRQDYLTSAEHRLRASANTVLVSSIPEKWLTEEALRGLFDVFPGGIRNIWLTRDLSKLLDKIKKRTKIHKKLESAETELIRACKEKQVKQSEAAEKKARKERRVKQVSKAEKAERQKAEDAEAFRRAAGPGGVTAGDHEEVPHRPASVADEVETDTTKVGHADDESPSEGPGETGFKIPVIGGGLAKVGHGLKEGVGVFGKAGQGIFGGVKNLGQGVEGELDRTAGFDFVNADERPGTASAAPPAQASERRRVQIVDDNLEKPKSSFASEATRSGHYHSSSVGSKDSMLQDLDTNHYKNTTRKLTNLDEMYSQDHNKWWQFWKPPEGGYASPVPQTAEGDEFPLTDDKGKKSLWSKIKSIIPFMGSDDEEEDIEYPAATNPDYTEENEKEAEWTKWLKESDRPHHRLHHWDWVPGFIPGLPLINKKVDTIYWCREELARLNVEIEEDQKHPERFPIMNSAFIQFNHQVAAHMACQCAIHHIPKHMAPRVVEISPDDVIWDNMAIKWWDQWARTAGVIAFVAGMVILWAIPVGFTATLSQIDALVNKFHWLHFLKENHIVWKAVQALAGVLPQLLLSLLLSLVPAIFKFLAGFKGAKTGAEKNETVQAYYFFFLFVQVFLVVSISSSATQTIEAIAQDVTSIPDTLATNLPKAANYFFSYMILQSMSVSSGTLLGIGRLAVWFIWSRLVDSTARSKFNRAVKLPDVSWGSFFPVYTNFACIGLIYCVIAPLISLFAILTFGLLWVAHRYSMLYVTRFRTDTGGVLYPRAINQTFTGLYVMELCLVGLFIICYNQNKTSGALAEVIIMIVVAFLTVIFQYLLNLSFSPLFRYLPITFEDEAILRDEIFRKAQARRLGLLDDDDEAMALTADTDSLRGKEDIELNNMTQPRSNTGKLGKLNPIRGLKTAGTWAARGGATVRHATLGKADEDFRAAAAYRRQRRQKDLEAQRAIGDALYGNFADEIEDLTPDERDVLVRKAFTHSALRARRPVVWIPRDDLGVSDDEVLRTREFSEHIWISNEGTALDSKVRAVYGRAPPDFSELDVINL
ncbi:DUF221-domain-containing protein [Pleurostoma richardsiae]|uniref:DUF221-domain-containing protein n=1 Tax=Pleurostoma richardsiae TaxID=41990 RepID=A0AA38RU33_9PEZI|nr:DUF221-domain-containing protein [Pleurostoma richardsiae]